MRDSSDQLQNNMSNVWLSIKMVRLSRIVGTILCLSVTTYSLWLSQITWKMLQWQSEHTLQTNLDYWWLFNYCTWFVNKTVWWQSKLTRLMYIFGCPRASDGPPSQTATLPSTTRGGTALIMSMAHLELTCFSASVYRALRKSSASHAWNRQLSVHLAIPLQ